jgi:Pyruvate/2-oxoacid:ferredoxin oxidoreductase delta subunit
MKRQIIKIDEEKCTGCGLCIPNCPEGALQIIDNKARLVCDLFCDGLGACIGTCPEDAIEIEEREAEPYDERKVMDNVVKQGINVIKAHLKHLKDHGQDEFYNQAIDYLKENDVLIPENVQSLTRIPEVEGNGGSCSGCPGSRMMIIEKDIDDRKEDIGAGFEVELRSELRQWPVQLQLLNPNAPYLKNADLVIAADCVPFTYPDFHRRFLKGKVLMILCPKLDQTIQGYVEKLTDIFKNQDIKSITTIHMEVPCCSGTGQIVQAAMMKSGVKIPVSDYTISLKGEIVSEKEF